MQLKCVAIDDEPLALELLQEYISRFPQLKLLHTFDDAISGVELLRNTKVDLLFIDINMPDISGIDLVRSLQDKPLIIFTTAHKQFAVEGFELDAVDYLLKPFSLARFIKGCNKAYELYNFRNSAEVSDHLFIKTGYEQQKVLYDEILYVEATGNYVSFVLKDKTILSRSTFVEATSLLPADKFVRVHRSYIVAVNKNNKVERHQVTIGKVTVPVSEAYSGNLAAALKK